jgi:hypothetical protein
MTGSNIAQTWFLQCSAPIAWRSEKRTVRKLLGYASTEAGSALDMLRAAELTDEPGLRALFFRHALDEARHARLFQDAARSLLPAASGLGVSEYDVIHATRQDLLNKYGLIQFVVFVHLAEASGYRQFLALKQHFSGRPDLSLLFDRIARDETFHIAYTRRIIDAWMAGPERTAVQRAFLILRLRRGWAAWKRAGRVVGDMLSKAVLALTYLCCLWPFAVVQRLTDQDRGGWHAAPSKPSSFQRARRQG